MRLGIRGKLFMTAAAAVTVLVLVSGLFLERRLRASQQRQIESELYRGALATCELVQGAPETGNLDEVSDRMGEVLGARVTIIAADGRVRGDSELAAGELATMESHASRPEVVAAREDGRGTARRHSTTLGEDMLYLAIPCEPADGPGGTVRVALPLTAVQHAVVRLRALLAIGGALGLGLALLGGAMASHYLSRDLRSLLEQARAVARSQPALGRKRQGGEVESLAHSIALLGDELKRHITTLAEERDRFAAVIEGMDAAVLAMDRQRDITLINARAIRLLRLPSEVVGQRFDDVISNPDLQQLVLLAEQGQTAFEEVTLPGNPPRIATVRATPQRASGGSVIVMHDITRQQRLETVRRDFVANVSHELRTPVTVIRANAETLLGGAMEDPERGREFLSAVLRSAERMSQIISDLLDLTRIESGKLALDIQPVPVHVAAAKALDSVAEAARVKFVDVRIDVDESVQVAADAQALDQILVNLMDNAVKYTMAGGLVVIETSAQAAGVRIAVRDDGPGIEPEHRDRIFERFYRVDKGRSREMGGTGLGLAIVKHLVGALGGEVGYEPVERGGSVFWFVLPQP